MRSAMGQIDSLLADL